MRPWRSGAAGLGVALLLAGCASRHAPDAVYRSSKGYRVTLPGQDWRVVDDGRADLELRHRQGSAGMLVNATCDARRAGRSLEALRREILAGFSHREVQERAAVPVAGRPAEHLVVDGQASPAGGRVRVELVVVQGERCVYDLVYAAPPEDFARWRGDFQRAVETFALE